MERIQQDLDQLEAHFHLQSNLPNSEFQVYICMQFENTETLWAII